MAICSNTVVCICMCVGTAACRNELSIGLDSKIDELKAHVTNRTDGTAERQGREITSVSAGLYNDM